jgi:hypothetical protein
MRNLPWQKIILSFLILTIIIGSSGCQSRLGKSLDNTIDAFAKVPDQILMALANLMGGLSDIGGALADQISNIIRNMTGR